MYAEAVIERHYKSLGKFELQVFEVGLFEHSQEQLRSDEVDFLGGTEVG
jgi:hypothetical protein